MMIEIVGIVGYGVYIPKLRIKVSEIASVWNKDGVAISTSLGLIEKAVASNDEDACTLAVEATRNALNDFSINTTKIGSIYVGSESHPYAVKPTACTVAQAVNLTQSVFAADLEFACKAGTAGLQICYAQVKAGMVELGLAIGTDTAQGKPNDALEFSAGSGAAAILIGKENVIAKLIDTYSITTDTPDFWRRQHETFPQHAGRFTGKPAYFYHVMNAAKIIMERNQLTADDIDHVVLHQPNAKFPLQAAKILGFTSEKIKAGLVAPQIGNTYSGSSMIGLCSVLDVAKPGEKILCVSYGSGSGSDAFIFEMASELRRATIPVLELIKEKKYIDYSQYLKHRRKIKSL
jgi:hydroxymethylglutaryl-CoA synthase